MNVEDELNSLTSGGIICRAVTSSECINFLQTGNHDQHRVASRYGPELVDGLNMLAQLLPGSGITYNGEEIGMEDTPISFEETVDPAGLNAGPERYELFSRDPERTPFQWDNTSNSGRCDETEGLIPLTHSVQKRFVLVFR